MNFSLFKSKAPSGLPPERQLSSRIRRVWEKRYNRSRRVTLSAPPGSWWSAEAWPDLTGEPNLKRGQRGGGDFPWFLVVLIALILAFSAHIAWSATTKIWNLPSLPSRPNTDSMLPSLTNLTMSNRWTLREQGLYLVERAFLQKLAESGVQPVLQHQTDWRHRSRPMHDVGAFLCQGAVSRSLSPQAWSPVDYIERIAYCSSVLIVIKLVTTRVLQPPVKSSI